MYKQYFWIHTDREVCTGFTLGSDSVSFKGRSGLQSGFSTGFKIPNNVSWDKKSLEDIVKTLELHGFKDKSMKLKDVHEYLETIGFPQ